MLPFTWNWGVQLHLRQSCLITDTQIGDSRFCCMAALSAIRRFGIDGSISAAGYTRLGKEGDNPCTEVSLSQNVFWVSFAECVDFSTLCLVCYWM